MGGGTPNLRSSPLAGISFFPRPGVWLGKPKTPPKLPVDPWGNPYIYYFPSKHNQNSYDLLSAGPDGKEGTDDDVVNWVK